jgi:hypothetical protein
VTSATQSTSTPDGTSTTASSASSGGASSTSDSATSTGDGTVTGGDTSTTGATTTGGGSVRPVPNGCTTILPGTCEPVVIAENQGTLGAFNLTATHLYWRGGDNVMRVDVNGGEPEALAEGIVGLSSVAVDDDGIYITADLDAPMVARLPLTGGTPTPLVTESMYYLDIEVADGRLYFSAPTPEVEGGLYSVSTEGGEVEQLYAGTTTILEVWRDYVYFIAYDAEAGLRRVPRAGGEVEVLLEPTVAYHLAVNDAGVHLVDEAGLIRLPLAGGTPEVLAPITRDPSESSGPALDSTHAYFLDNDNYLGDIVRAGLDASAPSALVSDHTPLRSIAVNDTTLFFGESTEDGRVLRIDKCGCP